MGINAESGDPDCFYLLFSGFLQAGTNFITNEQLFTPVPYKAAIVGGTGKYMLAMGEAIVAQDPSTIVNIDIDLAYVPSPLATIRDGESILWKRAN